MKTSKEIRGKVSIRLLLVEDDIQAANAIRFALAEYGFEVQTVNVGRQAIGTLIRHQSDAVVIDLTLPDVDGGALAKMIRHDWPDLPIIVVSGYEKPAGLAPLLEQRKTAFLQKPYDIGTLVEAIEARILPTAQTRFSPRTSVRDRK